MAEARAIQICVICHGTEAEHVGRQHAFTTTPGDLATPEQKRKREQGPSAPMVVRGPAMSNPGSMERMLEVLMDRGALSKEEVLYIVGVGPKPKPGGQYRDPVLFP